MAGHCKDNPDGNLAMIDENLSNADKAVLKQILGAEAYGKIEKLQGITVTYTGKK